LYTEDVIISPIINKTGSITNYVAVKRDITNQLQMEMDKIRMEEIMVQNEKMLSVGGLAAGMAHEINNPMAGIVQTANVIANRLIKKPNMPANVKAAENAGLSMKSIIEFMESRGIPRMIDTINDSAKRVTDIIENMLSFARKSENSKSSHDLTVLIDKIIQIAHSDLSFKIDENVKIVKIQKEYEEDIPLILCEGSKIQQVIFNILRNGVQAMEEARTENPLFIIRIKYNKKIKMNLIEIEDNGPGMAEDSNF